MKMILMSLLAIMLAVPASAGPLDLEQGAKWLIKQAAERGVVGSLLSFGGEKSVAAAILVGKTKKQNWAALAIGGEYQTKAERYDYIASPTLNVLELARMGCNTSFVQKNFDIMKFPEDYELWVGPYVQGPSKQFKEWTWKTHTGIFAALGKKYGGKPLDSTD